MKSGKYTLGHKTTTKSLLSGDGKLNYYLFTNLIYIYDFVNF